MISLNPSHWAMYYRPPLTSQIKMDPQESFELHAWLIARLIEMSHSNIAYLSHYVIAACYEKMITRMTYRVSKSFRDALKKLPQTFEFPKRFPLINGSNSNDHKFISYLVEVKIRLGLKTPIDNLVKHGNDLYNQETYGDFHSILFELLELLLKSLKELKEIHHSLEGKAPSKEQLNDTIAKIDFIAAVGSLLRLLVKSKAIKRCLYSIVGFLPDRAAGIKTKVDNTTDDDDDERDGDDEEDGLRDDEDELEGDESDSVGQGSPSVELEPKSQACLRSLNLGVVYIDAILVLHAFVKDQKSIPVDVNIDIKVLRLPKSKDISMLPWKTLLQNEMYFPGKPSPSAKEIVDFLELRASSTGNQRMSSKNTTDNQMSSKKRQKSKESPVSTEVSPESVLEMLGKLHRDIHNLEEDKFTTEIERAVVSLENLEYSTTLGYIQSIIIRLKSAKDLYPFYPNKLDMKDEINYIMGMLRTLAENTRLERMLQKGTPLHTGDGFKGRLHAEACIAAHCTFTDPEWLPLVSYFFIIMFCSDLLILLVVCYASSRCN
jgi:hypothetical protein